MVEPKTYSVYKITNRINGKTYIGFTKNVDARWQQHTSSNRSEKKSLISKAINKYGKDNFEFAVVYQSNELMDNGGKSALNEIEPMLIKEFNTLAPKGYNRAKGGQGGAGGFKHINNSPTYVNPMRGKQHNKSTRELISNRLRGVHSGNRNPMFGVESPSKGKSWYNNGEVENMYRPEEVPERYNKGRLPKSPETIDKISKSMIGNSNNKKRAST